MVGLVGCKWICVSWFMSVIRDHLVLWMLRYTQDESKEDKDHPQSSVWQSKHYEEINICWRNPLNVKAWEGGPTQNTGLESWLKFWDLVKFCSACCHVQFPLSTFCTNFPPTPLLSYYHPLSLTMPHMHSSTHTHTAAMLVQTVNNGASSQPPKLK